MKKIFLFLCLIIPTLAFSQNEIKTTQTTTLNKSTLLIGEFQKTIYFQMPAMPIGMGVSLTSSIKKIISEDKISYYFCIGTTTIEYSILVDIIKALEYLSLEVSQDLYGDPYQLENIYSIGDFLVGYKIEKGSTRWYLGGYETKDRKDLINRCKNAQMKIEGLMSKDKN